MPIREIATKTIAFVVVFAALLTGGILVLYGNHAYNDYLNGVLGWILVALAVATGLAGAGIILGIVRDARQRLGEEALHITPRGAPPAPPPAWGMGDVGRPGSGVVAVSEHPRGGGSPRLVSYSVPSWDAVLLIVGLLAWTAIFVFFFAPHCGGTGCT
ncbi:MAG TPA: hypothetical protein VEK76_05870 [Candidatus Binatia bacterium]|nr:hypothetical protein [Candidatus Binatia bacterium]